LSLLISGYKSYNFGVFAAGPNDHLYKLQAGIDNRFDDVKEATGDVIYHHLPFHLLRSVCTIECYREHNKYILDKPKYILLKDELHFVGKGQDFKYLPDQLYSLVANSALVEFVGFEFLDSHTQESYKIYVEIINQLFTEVGKRVKIRNKILAIDPDTDTSQAQIIEEMFSQKGIKVLNFAGRRWHRKYQNSVDWSFPKDSHPTPERNRYFAQLLAQYF
jgi:hypothetical protein